MVEKKLFEVDVCWTVKYTGTRKVLATSAHAAEKVIDTLIMEDELPFNTARDDWQEEEAVSESVTLLEKAEAEGEEADYEE